MMSFLEDENANHCRDSVSFITIDCAEIKHKRIAGVGAQETSNETCADAVVAFEELFLVVGCNT